ncbi:MAG: hypothetical protein KKC14_14790, partial [Alphaproteobacteria bacterium]|nr:hypothetical protein [Alphaproteobacteria bacterium]
MTASERILASISQLVAHFSTLSPTAWAINLGLTGLAIFLALGSAHGARRLARYAAHRLPGDSSAERTVRENRLARLVGRVAQLAAGLAAVLVVSEIWNLDLFSWTATPAGTSMLAATTRLVVLLIVAVAAFELSGLVIGRGMERIANRSLEPRRR